MPGARASEPNGASAAMPGLTLPMVSAATARMKGFMKSPSRREALLAVSAHARGCLVQSVDDGLTPRLAIGSVVAGDPVAAAEPGTIEIVAGPVDPNACTVRKLVDVAEPPQLRDVFSKRLVERKADEHRPGCLQHDAAEIFVERKRFDRNRACRAILRRADRHRRRPNLALAERTSLGLEPGEQKQVAGAVRAQSAAHRRHADDAGQSEIVAVLAKQPKVRSRSTVHAQAVGQEARIRSGHALRCECGAGLT